VRESHILWSFRYGFDYGSAHFVLMSTEHDFGTNSTQYKFLDQHIQNVDRSKTPWLIFAGHRLDSQNDLAIIPRSSVLQYVLEEVKFVTNKPLKSTA